MKEELEEIKAKICNMSNSFVGNMIKIMCPEELVGEIDSDGLREDLIESIIEKAEASSKFRKFLLKRLDK